MRGATWYALDKRYLFMISIHAPHARSDLSSRSSLTRTSNFNPRSSCEERHDEQPEKQLRPRPISIHAPHARSDSVLLPVNSALRLFQSTLLMRGATIMMCYSGPRPSISIHAPHARSDDGPAILDRARQYFNPRSSCEERHELSVVEFPEYRISIHAPHARSDLMPSCSFRPKIVFQSTLLMRGATRGFQHVGTWRFISIHAPHARSDTPVFAPIP